MEPPKYYLEKPSLAKVDPRKATAKVESMGEKLRDFFEKANDPYVHWDELRYKTQPAGLSKEEAWFLVRQYRDFISSKTFLRAESGEFFRWIRLAYTDEFLRRIDMYAGGQISALGLPASARNQFVVHGVMEEAIASSQLEGAHTTRAAAKKMLLEKREPRNESEYMILNNYRTMMSIEEQYKESALSMELLFSLHKKLTENTISPEQQGRLRMNRDEIIIQGRIGNEEYITHVPPNESFLNEEMERFIMYANDQEGGHFIHPVIKAIFLHFWIGYLHPFTDGNGRLARAIFYWYLLRKGYWTMMYLPISTLLKKAQVQYAMAYIHCEQDHFDLTYFYDFHIRKIIQSLNAFEAYLEKKIQENKKIHAVLGDKIHLIDRQKQLLHYVLSDQGASVTISSHAELNSITRQTAAKDIKKLQNEEFVVARREGKFIRYYPSEKLLLLKGKL